MKSAIKLRLNITPKVTLVFVLFAAGLLAGVSVLSYNSGRAALQVATVSDLLSVAIEKQAALNSWVEARLSDIVSLAASLRFHKELITLTVGSNSILLFPAAIQAAHDRVVEELQPWVGEERGFMALLVIEPEVGKVIVATDASEEGRFKDKRPYFINGRNGPYVLNPYYSRTLRAPAMTVSAPIRSANGRLLGVLTGRLNLDVMNTMINRRTDLHQTDDAFLVNILNLLITQPRFISDPAVLRRAIRTETVDRCLVGNSGVVFADDYRGVPVIAVYRWLAERQICLVVKIDQAEAVEPSRAFGNTILLTGSLSLLTASAVALGLARTITRPVLALQAGAMRFGRGQLELRLPETSGDELGLLAREFNTMAAALSEKEAQLRRRAEQLQRANVELARSNADLEQFAYVASHDLQEPLRMVASYTQLLAKRYEGQLDSDADEFIAYAVDGSNRMQRLINDLLAYSRVGTQGKDFEPTDCETVLDQALANLQMVIEESGTRVIHDPLPTVMTDNLQLGQLFQNLIGNAIKFQSDKPPEIHVGAEHKNGEWLFSIRDNGIGIDPKYAERIFVIFQRLHGKGEYPGTGIGLAICKKIVERHGGRIWVESESGQGSTFHFTISDRGGERP
ncbi:MAG: ATP-binding protein [Candidatus Bipolaricaulia bacterium]